jgi:SAM-dependent methyltransferase
MTQQEEFDHYAEDYDVALEQGLAVSGEDKNYFAQGRVSWLNHCLRQMPQSPKSVLDFGCGTGSAAPFLLDMPGVESVLGVDVSAKSLAVAERTHGSRRAQFHLLGQYQPEGQIDLAYCNGVFHHIPPPERAAAINYVGRALRPGGLFALWENNPWNPGTRYVMSRCPFDQDAITLSPLEAQRLVVSAGFELLRLDFLFVFPRAFSWFRGLEPFISRLPIGAQYQVLCRKS